ncbi:Mur ligase family protein [Bacillaceae bacterium W0354]
MNFLKLLDDINYHYKNKEELGQLTLSGITDNSRDVKEGYLFVAVKGYQLDGHDFIQESIGRGAIAVIAEKPLPIRIPCIVVENTKELLGHLASSFYNHPSSNKKIIGITGTNGKTTISYMLKAALEEHEISCGLIGTIEYLINGKSKPSQNTTPGAIHLQRMLAESLDEVVIIEVSSHALQQGRVNGVLFDLCVFTNLDGEHLDYHENMNKYFETKYLLFEKLKSHGAAIVNIDDEWGKYYFND